jgi:hypothetical protein
MGRDGRENREIYMRECIDGDQTEREHTDSPFDLLCDYDANIEEMKRDEFMNKPVL